MYSMSQKGSLVCDSSRCGDISHLVSPAEHAFSSSVKAGQELLGLTVFIFYTDLLTFASKSYSLKCITRIHYSLMIIIL
jgi:hypothetical protein